MSNPIPTSFPTKAARLEYFRTQLSTIDSWALRALAVIYARQTEHEQAARLTTEDNGVGFTGFDAALLTSFAKRAQGWRKELSIYSSPLSSKQMTILKSRIKKYAGQIIDHMGANAPAIVKESKVAA